MSRQVDRIPFNKPYLSGREYQYIGETINSGRASGNQVFTKKCHEFFESRYGFSKALLTTSCTDALELGSLLLEIGEGDEVILPSYTFVSTANPFVLRGAKLVFVDSGPFNPNIDCEKIEELITPRTKAIVVVHYGGVACDMEKLADLVKRYGLFLVEDAAQAIDSYYNGRPLGSFGDYSAFSFHETKNIICGEGGMVILNNERFHERSEILWEKGTNRSAFFRGDVNKYEWVDVGSSYLPSDILSAFLFAQLENLERIQKRRLEIWQTYEDALSVLQEECGVHLPYLPEYATKNGHLFYLVCNSKEERSNLITYLAEQNIQAVFHYLSLHRSPFFINKHDGRDLINCDLYSDRLLRLPIYVDLQPEEQNRVIERILAFYKQ